MNALDSPIEALAFNYLSYGFLTSVNSIWPWVAVLTAAVSFWRIRALSSSKLFPRGRSSDGASTPSSPLNESVAVKAAVMATSTANEAEAVTVSSTQLKTENLSVLKTNCRVLERRGSTKGKFTLYYCDKDECRIGDDEQFGGEIGGGAVADERLGRWFDDWERMMMVKMGDMGWYRYQDMTVLDGSVVRLWDPQRRRNAAVASVDGGVAW